MRTIKEIRELNDKHSMPDEYACPGRMDCLSSRCEHCHAYYHSHRGDRTVRCPACRELARKQLDREQWERIVSPWPEDMED